MIIEILSSGFDHYQDFVLPFVASVRQHEPKARLTIVDNGSPTPYPKPVGAKVFRTDNLAIMTSFNKAIGALKSAWEWVMLTDTDAICDGPFLAQFEGMDPACLYGQQMFNEFGLKWFDSWLLCIPRQIWEKVGPADEDFKITGAFQDLDYCIRAQLHGFGLQQLQMPFTHIGANTTHSSPDFWANREYNRGLILQKHSVRLYRP